MYKQDLVLNSLQGLICYKTQPKPVGHVGELVIFPLIAPYKGVDSLESKVTIQSVVLAGKGKSKYFSRQNQ